MRRAVTLLAGAAVVVPLLLAGRAPATADDTGERHGTITSFDGTPIAYHFFPAAGLPDGQRAPVVMVAHGYGETAPRDPEGPRLGGAPTLSRLLDAGYHVLTWDARGHGSSGGNAMLDSPDFEVRDTRRLIDWLARQPEVQLDGAGDPRVGMVGASYGGIIQYLTAAHDDRVDVIAPGYTAYSLATTTFERNGRFAEHWLAGIMAGGITNVPAGVIGDYGPHLHLVDPSIAVPGAVSIAAGRMTPGLREILEYRSPSSYLHRITVPTLVQGGTSDTLFPLTNAVRDFMALKRQGVPVKMSWNCEGHSLCPGDAGPLEEHFNHVVINWFDRWLKRDRSVRTGPQFTWIASNEDRYRSAAAYPPPVATRLTGSGSGSLVIAPTGTASSLGFLFIGGQPSAAALEVPIEAPTEAGDVVGPPRLSLTYRGTALPARTWVYAQVVDKVANKVVGTQVTAVPLTLDGTRRTVRLDLEPIASRATTGSRYALQLLPGSLMFGLQRSVGTVDVEQATISLPVRGH